MSKLTELDKARNRYNRAYERRVRAEEALRVARDAAAKAIVEETQAEYRFDLECGQPLKLSQYLEKQGKKIRRLWGK